MDLSTSGPDQDIYEVAIFIDMGVLIALQLFQQQHAVHHTRLSSQALAHAAAALLAFAELDSRVGGKRPPAFERLRGSMQLAATDAACLRTLVSQVTRTSSRKPSLATTAVMSAAELRQALAWLAEPTTPIATASAVLVEALPALESLAAACQNIRRQLASAGSCDWAPVARALHQRLPRRMAARFLPDVDRVSAAILGSASGVASSRRAAAAVGNAQAAVAALSAQQVRSHALLVTLYLPCVAMQDASCDQLLLSILHFKVVANAFVKHMQ